MKTITIVNHKGGVAKTDTANNLGHVLSMDGKRVLLIDADPQGNLSSVNNAEDYPFDLRFFLESGKEDFCKLTDNLFLLPSNLDCQAYEMTLVGYGIRAYKKLKERLDSMQTEFDYCIIDCAPSVGMFVSNSIIASDHVLIPVQPEADSFNAIRNIATVVNDCENINPNIDIAGVVFTKVRNTLLHQSTMAELKSKLSYRVFNTVFSELVEMGEARKAKKNIFDHKPTSASVHSFLKFKDEIYGI